MKKCREHSLGSNFVRSWDEHMPPLGFQAVLWGREHHVHVTGVEAEAWREAGPAGWGSRAQLLSPGSGPALSTLPAPGADGLSGLCALPLPTSVSPHWGLIQPWEPLLAVLAPHGACLRPLPCRALSLLHPIFFSLHSSPPSVSVATPSSTLPLGPALPSLSFLFHLFPHGNVYSPSPPLSFASGLSLPFTLLLSPSMFSCHLRATFIYLCLTKKEEEEEEKRKKGRREKKPPFINPGFYSSVQAFFLWVTSKGQAQTNPRRDPLPASMQALY